VESLDPLPIEELRERLEAVKAASPTFLRSHHRAFQHVLRLSEIARYIPIPGDRIWRKETPRNYQKELSWFFRLWDRGEIVRQKINGRWQLVRGIRDPGVAQVAPTPSSQAYARRSLEMKIELTPNGPRLRRI